MNTTALYFAEWREHFESDVFSLYHLCSERSGVCIDFCVVMKEDLTYTVSFKGTVIDFQKFLTGASFSSTITSGRNNIHRYMCTCT